jgi:hypothetical protein
MLKIAMFIYMRTHVHTHIKGERMVNARQQELKQNYIKFLSSAIRTAQDRNPENPYEVKMSKTTFLNHFSLVNGVGDYACNRYFEKFKQLGIFELKDSTFKLNPEQVKQYAEIWQIYFPEQKQPDKQTEKKK